METARLILYTGTQYVLKFSKLGNSKTLGLQAYRGLAYDKEWRVSLKPIYWWQFWRKTPQQVINQAIDWIKKRNRLQILIKQF